MTKSAIMAFQMDNDMSPDGQVDEKLVKALLDRVIQAFGPLPIPHTLAMYDAAGRELSDTKTLKEEGVKAGDHLLLRPSAVKGG